MVLYNEELAWLKAHPDIELGFCDTLLGSVYLAHGKAEGLEGRAYLFPGEAFKLYYKPTYIK